MNKPDPIKFTTGHNGRRDRFYAACPFSRMLCDLIKRYENKTAVCLSQWQIDKLKSYGFTIEVEEE